MILKLKDILPNPYRDTVANPLIEEKIMELVGSINLTGFWDNVVVRKNADGKYECAYGHHRIAAAIRASLTEADFIVKKLDDATMIQIMDNENRETYGSTTASIMESVKAIVKALAKGSIKPFVVSEKTNAQYICYAPSYVPGIRPEGRDAYPYTTLHIAKFLGRTRKNDSEPDESVVAALNALYLKERGRFNDALLITKDKTGAKVPVTTNELLRITRDIKREVERVDNSTAEAKKAAAEFDRQQREIQAQRKKVEEEAEEKCQKEVERLAKAKAEANKPKIEAIKEKIKEIEDHAVEKNLALEVKAAELDKRVQARKAREAEAKKEDAYLPIRREEDRLIHKMEQFQESFREEAKALSRNSLLNLKSRERLWQGADALESYAGWLKSLFINMAQLNPRRKSGRPAKR